VTTVASSCKFGVTGLEITADGSTLVVLCYKETAVLYNISTPSQPTPITAQNLIISAVDGGFSPVTGCQLPGAVSTSGYSDGKTVPGWLNSNLGVDILSSVSSVPEIDPLNPSSSNGVNKLCALTNWGGGLVIGTSQIYVYSELNASSLSYTAQVQCPFLSWSGTIAGMETFYHVADSSCNCASTTGPCPPGILPIASANISSIMEPFATGYFLAGRDYVEDISGVPSTTWSNQTWPVTFVNVAAYAGNVGVTVQPTVDVCGPGVPAVPTGVNFNGMWVIVEPAPTICSLESIAIALNASGAYGVIFGLPSGSTLQYFSGIDKFPAFFISNEMYVALLDAWNSTVFAANPGWTAPPSPAPFLPYATGNQPLSGYSYSTTLTTTTAGPQQSTSGNVIEIARIIVLVWSFAIIVPFLHFARM